MITTAIAVSTTLLTTLLLLSRLPLLAYLTLLQKLFRKPKFNPESYKVKGTTSNRFNEVKKVYQDSFREGRDVASQVAVYHKGVLVVNLHAGSAKINGGDEEVWEEINESDVMPIFSCTKIVESLVLSLLSDRGYLDFSSPITKYWKEFGRNGKQDITVEMLMRHQACLAAPDRKFTIEELSDRKGALSTLLADQRMNYCNKTDKNLSKNGVIQMYHSITRGLYANEIVKRVDPKGRSIAQFFREEISEKHGLGFYIGITAEEREREGTRILNIESPPLLLFLKYIPQYVMGGTYDQRLRLMNNDAHDTLHAYEVANFRNNIIGSILTLDFKYIKTLISSTSFIEGLTSITCINKKHVQEIELSSANGISNANSMAKLCSLYCSRKFGGNDDLFGSLEGKMRGHKLGTKELCHGLGFECSFSASGLGMDRLEQADELPGWIGWAGAGGQLMVWNEEYDLAFSYCTTVPYARIGKPRAVRLLKICDSIVRK